MDGAAPARALIMIAYAFLQSRRLKQAKRGKSNPRPAASATLPAIRTAIVAKLQTATADTMSALPPTDRS